MERVIYKITLAEMHPVVENGGSDGNIVAAVMRIAGLVRGAVNVPPPPSDADRDAIRSLTRLDNKKNNGEKGNGFIFAASNDATRALTRALASRDKMSILTSPQVAGIVGTPIHLAVGYETSMLEMKLLPVRHEDGKILTEIVVKRTDLIDGKEETYQLEMTVNVPTDNQRSLVMGKKIGDKEVVLFVTAWLDQQTAPVAVAQSMCDAAPATIDPQATSRRTSPVRSGITIQQPVTATFSVSSTLTCPDGGTVLLGSLRRLSEGQVERERGD